MCLKGDLSKLAGLYALVRSQVNEPPILASCFVLVHRA